MQGMDVAGALGVLRRVLWPVLLTVTPATQRHQQLGDTNRLATLEIGFPNTTIESPRCN